VVNRSLGGVVRTRWRLLAGRSERGSAMVEFHFLGIVLMMPLVYILVAVFSVQSATYGVTQAAREAGRVFVASGERPAAERAAELALADHRVEPERAVLSIAGEAQPCFIAGAESSVVVRPGVDLPLLPAVFADTVNAHLPVRAEHTAVVDKYRVTG